MKRINRIRWALLGIVAASVILVIAWPRPKLAWYTTPVLTVENHRFRITLLIPSGWQDHTDAYFGHPEFGIFRLVPEDKWGWLPRFLRNSLHLGRESAALTLELGRPWPDDPVDARVVSGRSPQGIWWAFRVTTEPTRSRSTYVREHKSEFDSTYKEILNSVRVEEVRP